MVISTDKDESVTVVDKIVNYTITSVSSDVEVPIVKISNVDKKTFITKTMQS